MVVVMLMVFGVVMIVVMMVMIMMMMVVVMLLVTASSQMSHLDGWVKFAFQVSRYRLLHCSKSDGVRLNPYLFKHLRGALSHPASDDHIRVQALDIDGHLTWFVIFNVWIGVYTHFADLAFIYLNCRKIRGVPKMA